MTGRVLRRRRALLSGLLVAACVVLVRGIQLQIVESEGWSARAQEQHRQRMELPAPRGAIYDRNGRPLASNQEAFRVAIAPVEVRDREGLTRRLRTELGLSAAAATHATDPSRRWVVLPGHYDAAVRAALEGVRGVYVDGVLVRSYPHGSLAAELLGRVAAEGDGVGGLELALDSVLRGRTGAAVVRRTASGEPIPGAMLTAIEPVPGHDVYLTIDAELQEIAEHGLVEAVRRTGASGGDLILADPATGDLVAVVSRRTEGAEHWTGVTEPFEPGSTLKPFILATLLAERRASLADSVYAEDGRWRRNGRTITDVRGYGWLTLEEALQVSSNIAFAKISDRLDPGLQYRYLRDFGFGSPTGITYPSESAGRLRHPRNWSAYSPASLAIGYEIAVTPLQMVLAYGALANGGLLLEPRLVREIRSREGRVLAATEPRTVRRALSAEVSSAVREVLTGAVEQGTGRSAAVGILQVAGKTGTSRRFAGAGYEAGEYISSFAGFFPADEPQLVFLITLDRPRGEFFGGQTAAPVMRETLLAALAARGVPLERGVAATGGRVPAGEHLRPGAHRPAARWSDDGTDRNRQDGDLSGMAATGNGPFVFALHEGLVESFEPNDGDAARPVPAVEGLPLRQAASALHEAGFRVELVGAGIARGTSPPAGRRAQPGTVVRLMGRSGGG